MKMSDYISMKLEAVEYIIKIVLESDFLNGVKNKRHFINNSSVHRLVFFLSSIPTDKLGGSVVHLFQFYGGVFGAIDSDVYVGLRDDLLVGFRVGGRCVERKSDADGAEFLPPFIKTHLNKAWSIFETILNHHFKNVEKTPYTFCDFLINENRRFASWKNAVELSEILNSNQTLDADDIADEMNLYVSDVWGDVVRAVFKNE